MTRWPFKSARPTLTPTNSALSFAAHVSRTSEFAASSVSSAIVNARFLASSNRETTSTIDAPYDREEASFRRGHRARAVHAPTTSERAALGRNLVEPNRLRHDR